MINFNLNNVKHYEFCYFDIDIVNEFKFSYKVNNIDEFINIIDHISILEISSFPYIQKYDLYNNQKFFKLYNTINIFTNDGYKYMILFEKEFLPIKRYLRINNINKIIND